MSWMHRFTRLMAVLALVAAAAPATADTPPELPKGYTTDRLPELPAGDEAAQPVSDTTEAAGEPAGEYEDTDPSALTEFREPLEPYGTWVVDATYGTVWVPHVTVVGADFAPYVTAGHWALTEDGEWLWVSDYEWGYIPFHYGRWVWIAGRGWAWIPGRVYAPAWVVWRVGDEGYIGWAPMPPVYYWSGGVAVSLWVVPPAAYVFCPTTHVFHHHVHHHIIHDHRTVQKAAKATHPYKPAKASPGGSAGGSGHKPAEPSRTPGSKSAAAGGSDPQKGAAGASHRYKPASPSLREAGVPADRAPKARVSHDRRAMALSKPAARSRAFNGMPAAPGGSHATAPPGRVRGAFAPQGPVASTPQAPFSPHAPPSAPKPKRSAAPRVGGDDDRVAPRRAQPETPSFGSASRGFGSAPSVRGGAGPAPRFAPSPPAARPSPRRR